MKKSVINLTQSRDGAGNRARDSRKFMQAGE